MKTEKTITLSQVLEYKPCYEIDTPGRCAKLFGKRKSLSYLQISKLRIPGKDKVWILTKDHFLTHEQQIQFAVFCAEQCIDIFEKKYPNDKRPRQAIEAAKLVIKSPTNQNKKAAANAAADAAAAAAYAANAAAAYAANAAADAAAAAAYAANAAADAAYAANAADAADARKSQIQFLVKLIDGKA